MTSSGWWWSLVGTLDCIVGLVGYWRIWILDRMPGFGLILSSPPSLVIKDSVARTSQILVESHLIDS